MSTTETGTALELLDRHEGELIDIRQAPPERLAAMVDHLATIREVLNEEEQLLGSELVARLDRRGNWTLRAGDPREGVQYEIKAPSPTAGTVGYDEPTLERGLGQLLEANEIDAEAADAALERTIAITVKVPIDADLPDLARRLQHAAVTIAGVDVEITQATPAVKVRQAGLNALEKMGGAAAALVEEAKRSRPGGQRRAKVKRVERDR